jgi:pyrroline-5-carboxylate reductase
MKIAVLGCGVMGGAFARLFSKEGHSLILCDHHVRKAKELAEELKARFEPSVEVAAQEGDVILLAIKPKDIKDLASGLGSLDERLVISIVAGATTHFLKEHFKGGVHVRCMPNLALLHGEAVMALVEDRDFSMQTVAG